jgi:siroheme synthase-like protein
MDKIQMSPVFLSPNGRTVTVFGGGRVALRKCMHFEGFRIKVVAEDILPELRELADEAVQQRIDPSTAGQLMEGADIVVAATSDHALNDSIRDISMGKGIMTNSAHGGGDLLIPSVLKRDGYTVTVSSEGRVPAFPPYVVRMLDGFLDESYDRMLELLMRIRPEIRGRIDSQPDRARFLADILEDQGIWEMLRQGRDDDAYKAAMGKGVFL